MNRIDILKDWTTKTNAGPDVLRAIQECSDIDADFQKCADLATSAALNFPEEEGVWVGPVSKRLGVITSKLLTDNANKDEKIAVLESCVRVLKDAIQTANKQYGEVVKEMREIYDQVKRLNRKLFS